MQKNIKLCGIGNGIVDMQYKISEEELCSIAIPKGEMRLIDEEKQKQLFKKLSHIKPHISSGGSATNTIDAFAKYGGKAAFLTCVGDDDNGRFYYHQLKELGIDYKDNTIANTPTGACFVLITPDTERTMLTSLAASSHFAEQNISGELIAASEWLYLEGYMFSETDAVQAIHKAVSIAQKHNTKIALTMSDAFIIELFRDRLQPVIEKADLIFCNNKEAATFAGTANHDEAVKYMLQYCPNVVTTKGKDGADVIFGGKHYSVDAFAINEVDATGAGDMFAGAFMYGMICLKDIEIAARLASYASAQTVAQLGPRYNGSFDELLASIV